MTIQNVKIKYQCHLAKLYEPKEIQSIFELIAEDLQFSSTGLILNRDLELMDTQLNYFEQSLSRLEQGEPVQYVRGKADFYDMQFSVNQAVLIPRPETEELVNVVIQENKNCRGKVLDIGTGSGCIAISLAKNLPNAHVSAIDISKDALHVAQNNSQQNDTHVSFYNGDMQDEIFMSQFTDCEIIVSNPPYVCNSEKKEMRKNVLDFEPHTALFVSDSNPLQFYKAIAQFASKNLRNGGKIYCEINETLGNETKQLFEQYGFHNCQIIKDLFGKDRIVKIVRDFLQS